LRFFQFKKAILSARKKDEKKQTTKTTKKPTTKKTNIIADCMSANSSPVLSELVQVINTL